MPGHGGAAGIRSLGGTYPRSRTAQQCPLPRCHHRPLLRHRDSDLRPLPPYNNTTHIRRRGPSARLGQAVVQEAPRGTLQAVAPSLPPSALPVWRPMPSPQTTAFRSARLAAYAIPPNHCLPLCPSGGLCHPPKPLLCPSGGLCHPPKPLLCPSGGLCHPPKPLPSALPVWRPMPSPQTTAFRSARLAAYAIPPNHCLPLCPSGGPSHRPKPLPPSNRMQPLSAGGRTAGFRPSA